jgi:hypothetical protein
MCTCIICVVTIKNEKDFEKIKNSVTIISKDNEIICFQVNLNRIDIVL